MSFIYLFFAVKTSIMQTLSEHKCSYHPLYNDNDKSYEELRLLIMIYLLNKKLHIGFMYTHIYKYKYMLLPFVILYGPQTTKTSQKFTPKD